MKGEICKIEGCTNILKKTEGRICQMHRTRFHRHGDYHAISSKWPNLKKGKPCLTKAGYTRVNIGGKRVLQHRYIMEQNLGRKLKKGERVHHKNGIGTDNRIENLELHISQSEHMKSHHPHIWKKRRIATEYSPEKISKILCRLTQPTRQFNTCFCNSEYMARNLCSTHYQWAYKHNFT